MPRPQGFKLNPTALRDVLELKRQSMTEAAAQAGIALTTLSGLSQTDHGASIKTVRLLSEGIGVSAETLFPELSRHFAAIDPGEAQHADLTEAVSS